MRSPKTLAKTSAAFGPCTAKGHTSGSLILTFNPKPIANPLAHNSTSESATDR